MTIILVSAFQIFSVQDGWQCNYWQNCKIKSKFTKKYTSAKNHKCHDIGWVEGAVKFKKLISYTEPFFLWSRVKRQFVTCDHAIMLQKVKTKSTSN